MGFNWSIWVPVVISLITGTYAFVQSRNTNKTTLNKAVEDNKTEMLKTNNEQSLALFEQYQKMNDALQNKVDKMQEKMEKMEEEFRVFRMDSEKEKTFLINKVEELEEENEDLREENEKLRNENFELKGAT